MVSQLLPAALFAAVVVAATAMPQDATTTYAGTMNMPNYANDVPLNISVTSGVATVSWVYDVAASGAHCSPDSETLPWNVTGNSVVGQGCGKDPCYYTFSGTLSNGVITGNVIDSSSNDKVGTWSAKAGAPMVPSTCGTTSHANIWPLPSDYTRGSVTVGVTPSTGFFSCSQTSTFLDQAFARYQALTFPHSASKTAPTAASDVTGLTVTVSSVDDSHPQLDTDETYTLSVPSTGGAAALSAKTVYGALRGLETFSQLVQFNFDTEAYGIARAPWTITDAPRFPHRGLMIDTARHWEPVAAIKSMIDSLPYAKLNVLHWHMSDTQSFPLEVKSAPNLWSAAWSPQERYVQADVADVVEYARLRGVRVMVEFDMPGHAGSWCKGYPDVCPSPKCTQPLNVANNATFDLITGLLMECTGGVPSAPGKPSPGLFKENFIHLGGDEVNTACWSSTPAVAKWLSDNNMTADQGYAYFVKRVAAIASAQGHRPVQWSEVYDHFGNTLPKEVVVHIWKSVTNVTQVVAGGYNVLVNVGYDALSWYLDNLNVMWDKVYLNEPCNGVPDDLCPKVLGGHGEMWGETVDASDIEQTVWPRLGAIAERLWSPRNLTSTEDAHSRIEAFRCLLNRRGIAAAPVNNADARSAPPGPGSCYMQ